MCRLRVTVRGVTTVATGVKRAHRPRSAQVRPVRLRGVDECAIAPRVVGRDPQEGRTTNNTGTDHNKRHLVQHGTPGRRGHTRPQRSARYTWAPHPAEIAWHYRGRGIGHRSLPVPYEQMRRQGCARGGKEMGGGPRRRAHLRPAGRFPRCPRGRM